MTSATIISRLASLPPLSRTLSRSLLCSTFAMTVIAHREIPEYLHSSAFYCSLSSENETDEIEVPDDCFKMDDRVLDLKDFRTLLKVMMFWGLDKPPRFVIVWCCDHPLGEWEEVAEDILGKDSDLFAHLLHIFNPDAPHARFQRAVEANQPEILEVLVRDSTTDQKCTEGVTEAAARLGHLGMLKVLHDHRFFWDEQVCAAAAGAGHLDCLLYAVENGCELDYLSIVGAAKGGHLQCVQFLHERCACEWDDDLAYNAAEKNHVDVLRYALEHGCDPNDEVLLIAAHADSLECMQYLLNERSMVMSERLFAHALNYVSVRCVRYLLDRGCPFTGFNFTENPDCSGDYDARLLECIKLVCAAGWIVSNELCYFVRYHLSELPLCVAHLQNGNHIRL